VVISVERHILIHQSWSEISRIAPGLDIQYQMDWIPSPLLISKDVVWNFGLITRLASDQQNLVLVLVLLAVVLILVL